MATEKRNTYLDTGASDDSDYDTGYDSEAAEISKVGRSSKRRKIEHGSSSDEDDKFAKGSHSESKRGSVAEKAELEHSDEDEDDPVGNVDDDQEVNEDGLSEPRNSSSKSTTRPRPISPTVPSPTKKKKSKSSKKELTPGVIYLSSLPPYLKPSALRNILEHRNFSPIKRIFLSPASKSNKSHANTGKNSRQLYTEGWIEFASKKTAKRCAETLNASTVGGKKGGYYRDDVWNMKYLRGMRWEELMVGVREEKREMEGRRDEERRVIAREAKSFIEGVEEGRRREGMKRKREKKKPADVEGGAEVDLDTRRTWRQNEVKGQKQDQGTGKATLSSDVRQVLGKIF
ncbi:RNA-binding ATPase activator esf2 [Cladophialophora chaetospira]|uniref:Pre-rRNA-processing protein ESF2 n=1 Tax=Cladophialophora chaetospira TaxID=386627 RepID=A0AA38XGR6_9EURO|nr:RNA-binding ATPase activator esf2 [Cladophialophora chaetospira]